MVYFSLLLFISVYYCLFQFIIVYKKILNFISNKGTSHRYTMLTFMQSIQQKYLQNSFLHLFQDFVVRREVQVPRVQQVHRVSKG